MANLNFDTVELANYYIHGQSTAGGSGDLGGYLLEFRNMQNITDQEKADITSLDSRIANFQNIITDGTAKTGVNAQDFPYDAQSLETQWLNEVVADLLKRPQYAQTYSGVWTGDPKNPGTISAVDSNGLLRDGTYYYASYNSLLKIYTQDTNSPAFKVGNFNDLTEQQKLALLTPVGQQVYQGYKSWIEATLAQGNKLKNNPTDPATGAQIVASVTTAISERTINGVTYDRVTYDASSKKYYLVSKGMTTDQAVKVSINGTPAYYDPTRDPYHWDVVGAAGSGAAVDSRVDPTPTAQVSATYLEVSKDLTPTGAAAITQSAPRLMSPMWYLYFWNEARIKVLRGQLNYKEAVTSEIRDDLAKANAAYADLEAQAGKTRAQSADGKTTNPDLSSETQQMDFFEATNSKTGQPLFDNTGHDDTQNYSEWGASRSSLKAYIDQKSTQSQDAMLDYQTTLNRFNNAYEVMSKLQEKIDGLVKSQLRNVN